MKTLGRPPVRGLGHSAAHEKGAGDESGLPSELAVCVAGFCGQEGILGQGLEQGASRGARFRP